MKNMKKLLAAIAALGFTTVATTNVVACSNTKGLIQTNDLTKSFSSSYQALAFSSDSGIEKLGLKGNSEKPTTYDFTAKNLNQEAVQTWVYANVVKAPINNKIVADVSKLPAPTALGVEAVQYSAKDQTGLVVQTDNAATVSFKITLTLFKSVNNNNDPSTFNYQITPTTMDVTINVVTQDIRQNLNDLTNLTIPATDAGNIDTFKNNLVEQIKAQTKFNNFLIKDLGEIQNDDKQKANLDIKDLVANDQSQTLNLIINANINSLNFKNDDKQKAIKVTITKINKVDISKITNTISITSPINDVDTFTNSVYNELAKDPQYPALSEDFHKLTLNKNDKTKLKPEDIINNSNFKLLLIATNDNNYYVGTTNITVNLTVSAID